MKKESYFERAIAAYRAWGRGEIMTRKDGEAVERALARMRTGEIDCVKAVYVAKGSETAKGRGGLARRYAADRYYSISQVYYMLKRARFFYAEERGILRYGKRR